MSEIERKNSIHSSSSECDISNDSNYKHHEGEKEVVRIPVRKDQKDYVAVIKYALGCSLVHLAMIFTIWFVDRPDIGKAEMFDREYMVEVMTNDFSYEYKIEDFHLCKEMANRFETILNW